MVLSNGRKGICLRGTSQQFQRMLHVTTVLGCSLLILKRNAVFSTVPDLLINLAGRGRRREGGEEEEEEEGEGEDSSQ